jgi:hypothetical protein
MTHDESNATEPTNGSQPVEKAELNESEKFFDIYLIDTGWNAPVSKAVRQNINLLGDFLREDHNLYILTESQSTSLLKNEPKFIGYDPIILVIERGEKLKAKRLEGFRLNLGLMRRPEQAIAKLQQAVRILSDRRTAANISKTVRKEIWMAGLDGAFRALAESPLEMH